MNFADWLAKKKIGPTEAAEILGCTRQQVWRLMRQHCRASPELADRIVAWSKGRVGLADLMVVDPERPRRLKGGRK